MRNGQMKVTGAGSIKIIAIIRLLKARDNKIETCQRGNIKII
jgi:hypothetical protein